MISKTAKLQRLLRQAKVRVLFAKEDLTKNKDKSSLDSKKLKEPEEAPLDIAEKAKDQKIMKKLKVNPATEQLVESIKDNSATTPSPKVVENVLKKEQFSENDFESFIENLFGSLKGLLQALGLSLPAMKKSMPYLSDMLLDSNSTRTKRDYGKGGSYKSSQNINTATSDMSLEDIHQKMFSYARAWKGTPYEWGGDGMGQWSLDMPASSANGIDCSGFIQKVLAVGGITPPYDMTASHMYDWAQSIGESISSPQPGALMFFAKAGKGITHIGMIAENGRILESRSGHGVTDNLAPSARANYQKAYIMPNYPHTPALEEDPKDKAPQQAEQPLV